MCRDGAPSNEESVEEVEEGETYRQGYSKREGPDRVLRGCM